MQFQKVDGPNQGQTYKSTKWTDPTEGQHHSSQSGRTQPGSNLYNSKKWTDPTRVKLISPQSGRIPPRVNTTVHKVDGPNQGQTYTSPKSGRTQQGSYLYKSKKRTDPTIGQHQSTKWTNATIVELTPVHEVDKPYQRSSPQSGWPSGVTTTFHRMDGPDQGRKLYKSPQRGRIKLSKH